jgi:hypothetical protein
VAKSGHEREFEFRPVGALCPLRSGGGYPVAWSSVDQDVISEKRYIKTVFVFQRQYQRRLTRLSVRSDGRNLSPLFNQRIMSRPSAFGSIDTSK